MNLLSGEKVAEFLDDIIYKDTQVAENGFDLTINKIYKTKNKGELDFGGGERKDAQLSEIKPSLRNPDDDYGWWELKPGTYLIEYNESLEKEKVSILQSLERLTRNASAHPTKLVKGIGLMPLQVGGKGIAIKENSRVSRILIPEK